MFPVGRFRLAIFSNSPNRQTIYLYFLVLVCLCFLTFSFDGYTPCIFFYAPLSGDWRCVSSPLLFFYYCMGGGGGRRY